MLRSLDVRPIHPKNGDKWRNNKGTFIFSFGRWVKINDNTQQRFCRQCDSEYEWSPLLQCMQCPKCTPKKIVPITQSMILEKMNSNG